MSSKQDVVRVRATNVGRLAHAIGVDFQDRVRRGLAERGFSDLKLAHNAVLLHVGLEGTRHTVIAERAKITRQAVGQLVTELEELGYVERRPDPDDGRAQRVCFTQRGHKLLQTGVKVIEQVEEQYAQWIGKRALLELRQNLSKLGDAVALDVPGTS